MSLFQRYSRLKLKRRFFLPLKNWLYCEAGQSLLEFVLVLPLLMLLAFALIQFGAIFNALITLNAAAREGARVMASESCLE